MANRASITLVLSLLLTVATARTFDSRDANVRTIIGWCAGNTTVEGPVRGESSCQQTLKCILNTVDAATSARWSAGASILAFIPTVAALMSNSVEEVVAIAEESQIMALALSLCSITVFAPRFGSQNDRPASIAAIKEQLEHHVKTLHRPGQTQTLKSRMLMRWAELGTAIAILMVCCVMIWRPVVTILRNGVVVLSCGPRAHVPIWVGLAQLTAVLNVLLRRRSMEIVPIKLVHQNVVAPDLPGSLAQRFFASHSRSYEVLLRYPKDDCGAISIRVLTSIMSTALYAFATGVLGAMTMFPASDAIRALVMFAAAAGIGRIIGSWASAPQSHWRTTLLVDVEERQVAELQRFVEEEVRRASPAIALKGWGT